MIRAATNQDATHLAVAERECFAQDAWDLRTITEMLAHPDIRVPLLLDDQDVFVAWAVWGGGEYAVAVRDVPGWNHRGETNAGRGPKGLLRLMSLAVKPTARGKGYGKELLQEGLEQARADGYAGVILEVRADNHAAQALYSGAGFVPSATLPGWFQNPAGDGIIMVQMFS